MKANECNRRLVCAGDVVRVVFKQQAVFERMRGEPITVGEFLKLLRYINWDFALEDYGIYMDDLGSLVDVELVSIATRD